MRRIDTDRFGRLTIEEGSIITFPEGLIRHPNLKEFAILGIEDYFPFLIFSSLRENRRNACFPIISPASVFPDYRPSIPEADMRLLGVDSFDDLQIYCLVSFAENRPKTRVDLKHPLVIHITRMVGCQSSLAGDEHEVRRAVDIGRIIGQTFP